MPNRHTTLTSLFDDIAKAIRNKGVGSTDGDLKADDFDTSIGSIVTLSGGTSGDDAAEGDLLFGKKAHTANGAAITGTMANNGATGGTITSQGGTYTIPAGYTSGGTVTASITAGSHSGTVSTHTVDKPAVTYKISGTATNISSTTKPSGTDGTDYWTLDPDGDVTDGTSHAKAKASIGTAGYISADSVESSDNTKPIGVTVTSGTNRYISKATSSKTNPASSATNGTATITKQPSASVSVTSTGIETSDTATSYYVTASANSASGTISATGGSASTTAGSVTVSAGYNPSAVTASVAASSASGTSASTEEATASDRKTIYIKAATPAVTGGTVSGSTSLSGSNVTLSNTNNGISVSSSGTASRTKITYNGAVDGYVKVTNGSDVSGGSAVTGQSIGSSTKYITAITVPTQQGFSLTTAASTSSSTADPANTFPTVITNNQNRHTQIVNNAYGLAYIDNKANGTAAIDNAASGIASIGNAGTSYVSVSGTGSSHAGSITIDAYDGTTFDIDHKIVNNGEWVKPSVTAAGTFYGKVTVGSGSATTPATTVPVDTSSGISWDASTKTITVSKSDTKDVTPSVSAGYVSAGTVGTITARASGSKTLTNAQLAAADSNIAAGNIKTGVTILGVEGTYTSDGDAKNADILYGKIAYADGNKRTGSMTNQGAVTGTISSNGGTYTIPAGYHNGSGVVTASIPNIASTTTSNNFTAYQEFTANSPVTASTSVASAPTAGSIRVTGGIAATSGIIGSQVYNAVWNDLADAIPVDDACELEYGYCYCFDGEHYYKSSKYLDNGIIGIHSDTAGFVMGTKGEGKEMQVAVAGFVLAYVDKEYLPGTLLTCTENGWLTEISKQDKIENPEKVVASFWKPEVKESWGSPERQVKVNGRMWVKVR